jgi:glycosyltransferase involved in cell wall biosynthesis
MRILLSAYACAPNRGSEPGMGWHWATTLAARHEVHVLTAAWSEPFIHQELEARPNPNLHFHFVRDLAHHTSQWPLGLGWFHQYLWQYRAYRLARRLHARGGFDLAHHVSYSTWRVPSFLVGLGIPFVWGPIGGGHCIPPGFARELGWGGAAREFVRSLSHRLCRFDPFIRHTLQRASMVLAANTATLEFLRPLRQNSLELMLETAAPPQIADTCSQEPAPRNTTRTLHLLWVGQMVPLKALPLLLKALARLSRCIDLHVDIIGEGPRRKAWQSMVQRMGIADQLTFHGQLPFARTQAFMRQADALVFTSLRETSGNVVLEAMSAGVPVVCLDWTGPHDLTSDACAMRIAPRKPDQVITELSAAIEALAADPERRRAMGRAGQARVRQLFTWTDKAAQIQRVYDAVLTTPTVVLAPSIGGAL